MLTYFIIQKSAKRCCSSSVMGSFWFLGVSGILSNQHASNSFLRYGTQGAGIFLSNTNSQSTPLNHLWFFTDSPSYIISVLRLTPPTYTSLRDSTTFESGPSIAGSKRQGIRLFPSKFSDIFLEVSCRRKAGDLLTVRR